MSREEFREYWMRHHAALEREIAKTAPVKAIKVSFAVTQYVNTDGSLSLGEETEPDFDALLELYFDELDDLHEEFRAADVPSRIVADEREFVDHSRGLTRVITEEETIVG